MEARRTVVIRVGIVLVLLLGIAITWTRVYALAVSGKISIRDSGNESSHIQAPPTAGNVTITPTPTPTDTPTPTPTDTPTPTPTDTPTPTNTPTSSPTPTNTPTPTPTGRIDPLMKDKLLDLVINIISIILGGGIIVVLIEWRRYLRERRAWKLEDQLLQIDIPRTDIWAKYWEVLPDMSDKEKLRIYENKLEDSARKLVIVAHFVIRNTTSAEIVVTSYNAKLPELSAGDGYSGKQFYELETADLLFTGEMTSSDTQVIKLPSYGTMSRVVIMVVEFDARRRLEATPSTLIVEATTSSGITIQEKATLNPVPQISDIEYYDCMYHPKQYVATLKAEEKLEEPEESKEPEEEKGESEIPF